MAINVNKVYRTVLAILNREQRGYLTPDQFNRLARHAQLDMLEKSFYDYNRALNKRHIQGVNTEYGDIAEKIEEKIEALTVSNFLSFTAASVLQGNFAQASLLTNTSGDLDPIYKILSVSTNGSTGLGRTTQVERMKKSEFLFLNASKLTAPTESFPSFYVEDSKIYIYPGTIGQATIDYVKVPKDPKWGYTINGAGAYIYDGRTIEEAQGGEIYTQEFTATEGQTNFTITTSQLLDLPANKINVRVNDVTVTNYTISNNIITFDTGLTESDSVSIQASLYQSIMGSTDFELHASEETGLTVKILGLAGVVIKDPLIVQTAQTKEVTEFNQQNS